MARHALLRNLIVCCTLGILSATTPTTALADQPPPVSPGAIPSDGSPGPPEPTQQRNQCMGTHPLDPATAAQVPPAQRYLDFESTAWKFTRGAGQTIAVVDTGVTPGPWLPNVTPGGDYVGTGNGLDDCDVHGTIVAGIIGGRAPRADPAKFSGVAPDARIISIRQNSSAYDSKAAAAQKKPGQVADGYGDVHTLARAIVHAVNLGATVINLSIEACYPQPLPDSDLGAALYYAAAVRNVVVVAAAGNNDKDLCKPGNPNLIDPLHPNRSTWDNVTTYVSPAWYSRYVLAVGSIDETTGLPSSFSIPGPWVGVAAPGQNIVSVDPRGPGLTNSEVDGQGKTAPLAGTSFASPYVAGIAALVRARYPELTAAQVIARIERTAHAPGSGWNPYIGYGIVDPAEAVTANLPADLPAPDINPVVAEPASVQLPIPAPPKPVDHTARTVGIALTASIAMLLILGMAAAHPLRKLMSQRRR